MSAYENYREQILKNHDNDVALDKIIDDAEEAAYMDGTLTDIQYETLVQLRGEMGKYVNSFTE